MLKKILLALLFSLTCLVVPDQASSVPHQQTSTQQAPAPKPSAYPSAPEPGIVDVGSAKIHYEEAGVGDALVMIHGGLLTKEMWDGHFEEYAKKYRVVRYDARNHGLSRSEAATFAHFDDLNKLMEHLKIEKAVIMGLSMGGYIAVDFALKFPGKVSGLILVAPGLSGFSFHGPEFDAYYEKYQAAVKSGDPDRHIEAFMEGWTYGPYRKAEDLPSALLDKVRRMAKQSMETWNGETKELRAAPLAIGRLAEIKAPALAIVGDLDMPNILEIVGLLEKDLPNFEKVTIPGVAHMVNLEKPQEFDKAVLGFLKKTYGH